VKVCLAWERENSVAAQTRAVRSGPKFLAEGRLFARRWPKKLIHENFATKWFDGSRLFKLAERKFSDCGWRGSAVSCFKGQIAESGGKWVAALDLDSDSGFVGETALSTAAALCQ